MSHDDLTLSSIFRNKYVILIAVVASLAVAAISGAYNPLITLGMAVLCGLFMLLLRRPNLVVILVAFIIYTNTAVVMIKFHNVPPSFAYVLPLLLVIPFTWQVLVNKQPIRVNFVLVLMLIFFAVMLLGSAFSRDIKLATPSLLNYFAEGIGLYFLLINTIRTTKLLNQVVWSLLVGGALIGGLSLYQQITGTFNHNYYGFAQVTGVGFTTEETLQGAVVQPRVSGSIGEKNRYAQIMLMLFPLGLFMAWGEKNWKLRLTALVLTGLILIGGSLAFSRGAQVAFLLMILIMIFMRYIKISHLLLILAGLLLLLLAFPQNTVRFASLANIFSSQDEGGLRNADGAIQGRATEMLAATMVFMDHPFIGVGPGMFRYEMEEYSKIISLRNITTVREAHSLYPGVAAETGILGFITLMAIFFYTLYRLAVARAYWLERNQTRMAGLCAGFFLSVIGYMTTGIFLHMSYIRYLWLIIALSIIASEFREADVEEEEAATVNTMETLRFEKTIPETL